MFEWIKTQYQASRTNKIIFWFFFLVIVGSTPSVIQPNIKSNTQQAITSTPAPNWEYSSDIDTMTGKPIQSAFTISKNKVELEFPYQGGTYGLIRVRKHPRFGSDVIFQVNKGQILCGTSSGCSIVVRFDDQKSMKVQANEPSDHGSETLFLEGFSKLTSLLKKSKVVVIEVTFFKQGNRQFKFNVDDFKGI